MHEKRDGGKSRAAGPIEPDDPESLRYWTSKLSVDERTLKAAIREAGTSPASVRAYLKTSRTSP
jgi:hypothetical protein